MRDVQRTVAAVAALLAVRRLPARRPSPRRPRPSIAVAAVKALAPRIEQNLRENVVPFWFPRCVDTVNGGYTVHYGPKGEVLGGGVKMIVTQSRQLWLASALLRSRYAIPGLRDAADHGYRFLRDVMWDKANGGFYWQVDVTGKQVMRGQKHLYGQAFAIYAVAEYAMATGNKEALAFALDAFRLIDAKAHDGVHGGYREVLRRRLERGAGRRHAAARRPGRPQVDEHPPAPARGVDDAAARQRGSAGPRAPDRAGQHRDARGGARRLDGAHRSAPADWTPILDPAAARVSYGHDLENIWLVADALDALNQPIAPYTDFFRSVFAYSRQHGWDDAKGGFYDSGPKGQPADRRQKVWWVQAEVIVAALEMYRQTKDAAYLDVFEKTWRFIDTAQTDWTNGEWFESIAPDGTPSRGNKATPWKAGYHNGRALLQVLDRLSRLP